MDPYGTGTRPLWDPIMTDPNKIFLKSTLSPPPPWLPQASLLKLATHQSAQWPPASPIPACPPSVDPSSSCPPPPVRPGVAAAAPGFCHQPSSIPGAAGHPASARWRGISCRTPTPPWLNPWPQRKRKERCQQSAAEPRCLQATNEDNDGQCDESEPIAATTKLSCRKDS